MSEDTKFVVRFSIEGAGPSSTVSSGMNGKNGQFLCFHFFLDFQKRRTQTKPGGLLTSQEVRNSGHSLRDFLYGVDSMPEKGPGNLTFLRECF